MLTKNVEPIKQTYLLMNEEGKFYTSKRMPKNNIKDWVVIIDAIQLLEWVDGLWLPLLESKENINGN